MEENIYDIYNEIYKKTEDRNDITRCNICKNDNIILDKINSYKICENCGVVDKILFNDLDLDSFETASTNEINYYSRKSSFRTNIKGNKNNLLIKLHSWIMNYYKEDTLNKDFKDCSEKCKKGKIKPYYHDIAKMEQKKMSETTHLSGKNEGKQIIFRAKPSKQIKSGFLYDATKCSEDDIRTPKEIAKVWGDGFTASDVNKGTKMKEKYKLENNQLYNIPPSNPKQYIKTKCKKMNLEKQYIEKSLNVAENNEILGICCGPQAPSIAAACILLICNEYKLPYTKKDISEIFDIKIVTIENVYNQLIVDAKKYYLLMDTDKLKKIISELG